MGDTIVTDLETISGHLAALGPHTINQ
jgi:hypothetical protein